MSTEQALAYALERLALPPGRTLWLGGNHSIRQGRSITPGGVKRSAGANGVTAPTPCRRKFPALTMPS